MWNAEIENRVNCFEYNGSYCYAGMSGDGQIIRSSNRFNWEKYFQTDDYSVSAIIVSGEYLFAATSPNGIVYKIKISDGSYSEITTFNEEAVGFFEFNKWLYICTKRKIYRYEPITNSFTLVYEPYGNVTDVITHNGMIVIAMDKENLISFNGSEWKLMPMGKDNVSSIRNIVQNPFSKLSFSFIDRDGLNPKKMTDNEYFEIMPYNKESGISSIASFGSKVLAGGKNFSRIYSIGDSNTDVVFDTDENGVNFILPIDSKTILASIGETIYLGRFGALSNPLPPVEKTTVKTVTVQNPSEVKNIKINSPNGGEKLKQGDTMSIKWESTRGISDSVKLELYKDDKLFYSINGRTGNSGAYDWVIPSDFQVGTGYKIYIEWLSASETKPEDKDISDASFEIQAATTSDDASQTAKYPDQYDRWYFVKIMDLKDEYVTAMSIDNYYAQILLGTSNGRILATDAIKMNAYATGNRGVYASVKNEYGVSSDVAQSNVMYSLYKRVAEITSDKSVEKWKFARMSAINPNQNVTGVFISPIINVKNDFGMWKTLIWEEVKSGSDRIRIFLKASNSISGLYTKDWQFGFESKSDEIGTITRSLNNIKLDGNYLQIKVEMNSSEEATLLSRVSIEYSTKNASYFFTTNFEMNTGEVATRGLVTANVTQPTNTEISFGVTNKNSADWNDYQVVTRDEFFSMENFTNMKIGVKFVSYDDSLPQVSEFSLMRNK